MSEEQINSLTYEFESVAKRLDLLAHFTSGYADLFHQRAQCELMYAKALQQQCGQPVKSKHVLSKDIPLDKFEETMKNALQSFNEETVKVAQKHHEMGTIFLEQIAKPFDTLQRSIELTKRKIINDFLGQDKKFKTLIKTAQKNQDNYKKCVNELRQLTKQLETNTNPQIIDKLVAKKQQTYQRAQSFEILYKESVTAANKCGEETFNDPVRKLIAESVELIKNQFEAMKNALNIISTQLSELMPVEETSFAKMKEEIGKIDFEKDFDEFVKKNANVHNQLVVGLELEDLAEANGDKKPQQPTPVVETPKEEPQPTETPVAETPKEEEKKEDPEIDLN